MAARFTLNRNGQRLLDELAGEALRTIATKGQANAIALVNVDTGALQSDLQLDPEQGVHELGRRRLVTFVGGGSIVNPESGRPTHTYAFWVEDRFESVAKPYLEEVNRVMGGSKL